MSFRIGQRVRAVRLLPEHAGQGKEKYLGEVGTVVSRPEIFRGKGCVVVDWDRYGVLGLEPLACLAPVEDDGDFQRFMERVLKPVDLKVTTPA